MHVEKYENSSNDRTAPSGAFLVPKKRKLKPSIAASGATNLEEVNEIEERTNRNLHRLMEQATKFTSPQCTPERRKSMVSNAGMTNAQIAEHYSNCLKLSAENKINHKNAFDLHLIDLMSSVLSNDQANFQTASSTLDAGAKIYAYRVDSLYKETYKIYGGLGRSDKAPLQDDDDAAEDERVEDEQVVKLPVSPVAKKKKKKAAKGSCIETNEKALNAISSDAKYQTDELFESVRASFEEGNTSGLFLNTLSTLNDFNRLVLHSFCKLPCDVTVDLIGIECESYKEMLNEAQSSFQVGSTCPAVSNFDFCNWSSTSNCHEDSKSSDFPSARSVKKSEFAAKISPVPFNSNCAPDFSHLDPHDASILNESINIEDVEKKSTITDQKFAALEAALSSKHLEYSYFDPKLMQTWLGPDHWKLKRINNAKTQAENLTESQKKLKAKKVPRINRKALNNERIDFNENPDFRKILKADSRGSTVISDACLTKLKNLDLSIDPIVDDMPLSLLKLFLKSNVELRSCNRSPDQTLDDSAIGEIDMDKAADLSNYCPDSQPTPTRGCARVNDEHIPFGDVPDDDGDYTAATILDDCAIAAPSTEGVSAGLDATINEENMVEQPYKINKIDINYAKHAKRIDVKKLKSAMWKIITCDERDESAMQLRQSPLPVVHTSFANLCKKLPEFVSSQMMQNLSVHTSFTVLLHMCNEKNLELKGSNAFDDAVIYQRQT